MFYLHICYNVFIFQEKCHQYWPSERSARYQYFVVDPMAEYNMPQYILREFKVTDARVSKVQTSYCAVWKTCVKWPLSKRHKIDFQDRLSLNAGQKYCRMLQGEHSAILLTFIKLPFVIKTFVLSIFEWPFYTGFTVCVLPLIIVFISILCVC